MASAPSENSVSEAQTRMPGGEALEGVLSKLPGVQADRVEQDSVVHEVCLGTLPPGHRGIEVQRDRLGGRRAALRGPSGCRGVGLGIRCALEREAASTVSSVRSGKIDALRTPL